VTPSGTVAEYPLPDNASTHWITTGSDGNLWADNNQAILKIVP
jgi:streptogramin lyase